MVVLDETVVESPENLQYSYLDKFQIMTGPCQIPPHKCAGCGRALVSSSDTWVDWNFDVDFYGQVIICTDCFRQAANQLEYAAPEQWKEMHAETVKQFEVIQDLLQENKRLRDVLASLGLIGLVSDGLSRASVGEIEESVRCQGGEGGDASVSSGGSESADSPESESDGSDASKGSSQLHGDDTLDELIAGI